MAKDNIIIKVGAQYDAPTVSPFDTKKSMTATTRYRDGDKTGRVNMSKSLAYAVIRMLTEKDKIAAVQVTDDQYAVEYRHSDSSVDVVSYNKKNGVLEMTHIVGDKYEVVSAKKESLTSPVLSAIYAAIIIAHRNSDPEIQNAMDVLVSYYNMPFPGGSVTDQDAVAAMFQLCGTIYYGIKNDYIKLVVDNRNIANISKFKIEQGALNGVIILGEPQILSGSKSGKKKNKSLTVKECRAEFEDFIKTHNWTNEEKALIYQFDDNFPVPPEAYKMASLYIKSKKTNRPWINFMWRGITAYGKSTGVEIMSCILDMPLLKMTCFPTMETQNFLSDFVPDTSNYIGSLPTFEEIAYDPEGAYHVLTGEEKENVTSQEVLEEYGKVVAAQNSTSPRFKHVISNYVKALTKGYIVEIQESSRIKDNGVLVGLNEYDRQGALIPLIDGTYKRRHEDAMVIYTDNVGYASCRALDPSVIRRCSLVIDSYDMPKERIKQRCMYNTGCDDITFEELYDVYSAVESFCKDHDITEGAISVNELEMFIMAVMMGEDMADAVQSCLISKATSDIDEQNEILAALGTVM